MNVVFLPNTTHSFRHALPCATSFDLKPWREAVDMRRSNDGAPFQIKLYGARERGLDEVMPLLQNIGLRVLDQIQS